MKEIKVEFKTLTPLWTGDAWGECGKIKLTGLIGSLRWWFEALVRGMGYKACDSTSYNKCDVKLKNPEDILEIGKKICQVCFLFGTTGWKSKVSFEIEEDNLSKPYEGQIIFKISDGRGWYFPSGLMGEATLRVRIDEFIFEDGTKLTEIIPSVLKILLYLIQEYGMFGAKTSIGYGVVKFTVDGSELSVTEDEWANFTKFLGYFKQEENHNLPNLKDMFFVKFSVTDSIEGIINSMKSFMTAQNGIIEGAVEKWKDKKWVISSPIVRYCLRCVFRGKCSQKVCQLNRGCSRNYWWNFFGKNNSRNKINRNYKKDLTIDILNLQNCDEAKVIRHFLMGSINEKEFSAVQVSHVYNNNDNLEFRIWGWLPNIEPIEGKVNDILGLLAEIFKNPTWNKLGGDIQKNICWNDTERELRLIEKSKNIKTLIIGEIK